MIEPKNRNQLRQSNNQMAIERETDQANNKRARACINDKQFYKQIQKTFKKVSNLAPMDLNSPVPDRMGKLLSFYRSWLIPRITSTPRKTHISVQFRYGR